MNQVRVRFAPSPTGTPHLGNIRSALFNWLFAAHSKGKFILRIEDTDRDRLIPESVTQIVETLKWLGLEWAEGPDKMGDFGPYVQSERLDIYTKYASELIASKVLYPCWCDADRLDTLRKEAQKNHKAFQYDRHCLNITGDLSKPHVLRFFVPAGQTEWDDAVKGKISIQNSEVDDFVAIKSDGYPTYNFANVVDDYLMQISHVLRADEFVPSTPKHLMIYDAFGWPRATFAHLPAVLGPDKAKLSKRHGAKSVLEYRDEGYLPEALLNYLTLLGWNPGDGSTKEFYDRAELVDAFSLERIQKSPAVFDAERLNWMNGHYIRNISLTELDERASDFWPQTASNFGSEYRLKVLGLVQERLKYLAEIPELTDFFFEDPGLLEVKENWVPWITQTIEFLDEMGEDDFTSEKLEVAIREKLVPKVGESPGQLFAAIRVSITGKTAAPGIFDTLSVLGRETVLRRLKKAISGKNLL